jgi:anti-sigma B factor antagonist
MPPAICHGMPTILDSSFENDTLHLSVNVPRLDAATARDFKNEFLGHWQPATRRLTINLSHVDFLDSSGIGALLSLYKRLPAPNASVRLLNVKPAVQSVFELMRMHRVFEIQN